MKNRMLMLLLACGCSAFFFGCSTDKNRIETSESVTVQESASVTQDALETTVEELPSYPSETAGSVLHESKLGYSCMFDPTVFVLDDTGEGDSFYYMTAEELLMPVYMSVQKYIGMSADELASGLVLQSGCDESVLQDTYFGADSIETSSLYIEQEVNGVGQVQVFYIIPVDEGALLVELGGYEGMPEAVESKLEEITATFLII